MNKNTIAQRHGIVNTMSSSPQNIEEKPFYGGHRLEIGHILREFVGGKAQL